MQCYTELYFPAVLAAMLLSTALGLVAGREHQSDMLEQLFRDAHRLRQLLFYLLFSFVGCLIDGFFSGFSLPYWQLSLFVLVSDLLVALQLVFLSEYTYQVILRSHQEEEYLRLQRVYEEETARQLRLRHIAYRDNLTGVYNRKYAVEMMTTLQKAKKPVTVAYIDVNGLKAVNDTLGHSAGDRYLTAVADCLKEHIRPGDMLARIGGDEFIILSTTASEEDLLRRLEAANTALERSVSGVKASFSYGATQATAGEEYDVEQLLQESDRRMYLKKGLTRSGRRG